MNAVFSFMSRLLVACAVALGMAWPAYAAAPVVSNVECSQRAGSGLVDIYYDLASPSNELSVSISISTNSGVAFNVGASAFSGDVGSNITPGTGKHVVWNAGADMAAEYYPNVKVRVSADDGSQPSAPANMVLIPAGSFTMGDSLGDGAAEGYTDEVPLHTVNVSAFYMDEYDVTEGLWNTVYSWAIAHGYSFDDGGSVYDGDSKGANYPVVDVDWYDCVKWCNARSEMEGRVPAYYTDDTQTVVYRTGEIDLDNGSVKWGAGYRLATEAEWEKAARGGASGERFPWGNTISESQANYYSFHEFSYDLSDTGYNQAYDDGVDPYTSPVNAFAPNGYGLYDMAGNVWQWCWDWYGAYGSASQTDPRGPRSGSRRVRRGGGWYDYAFGCRTADRGSNYGAPFNDDDGLGFRSVLPPGQ